MIRKLFLTLLVLIGTLTLSFGQDILIQGVVKDSKTKIVLKNVNIIFPKISIGCTTNATGKFSIKLCEGIHKVQVSSIGYKTKNIIVNTKEANKSITILLDESVTNIDEVAITSKFIRKPGSTTAKVNVPLKDIPITVSTLGKDLIEQVQVTSINDAMRYATGVKPSVNYGGFQTFKFRGLGKPVIMVDGAVDYRMSLSNSAPVTSLAAVDRIEYLKGPASVTYGHSADGGIINIIRKQPTENFTANFSTYYGSWNNKGTVVGAGGKLSDKVNYRFDASYADKDGWRDFAEKTANVYLAVDYNINDKNKLEFRVGGNDDFYATETGFPVFGNTIHNKEGKPIYKKGDWVDGFKRDQRYNDPQDFFNHENVNASIKYSHDFSASSNLSIYLSYTQDYIDYFSTESLSFPTSKSPDYNFYFENKSGEKTYIDIANITRSYPFRFAHQTNTFQNNIDYTAVFKTGSIKHNFHAGYSLILLDRTSFKGYGKDDIFGPGKGATISIVNPILNQGFLGEKFSAASLYNEAVHALYAHDLIDFSNKFKAIVALRLDYYDMKQQSSKIKGRKTIVDKSESTDYTKQPLSYRLGLVYEPISSLSLYTSFSNFFRPNRKSNTGNAVYIGNDGNVSNAVYFEPEKGYQGEIGFKYDVNSKFQFNGSIYYINKENIVQYVGRTAEDKSIYAQIGQVDSKGFELDMHYKPLKSLSITAGYTFCAAQYQEFAISKYQSDNKGNYLNRNPKNQFYMWSYYEVPKGILKDLNIGLGVNYTDKMFTNTANSFEIPSYWLTEAAIGYKIDRINLKLKVNNLFDKDYCSNSVMSNQFIPGAERNYLLTVGYKF